MAHPTKKGQRVIVRNDQDLIFTVDNFLGAKEQKARDYGLNDTESLAVWIEGDQYKIETYFGNRSAEYVRALQSGKNNLVNTPKNWEL